MDNTRITKPQPGLLKLYLKNGNTRIKVIVEDRGLYWAGQKVDFPMNSCWPKKEWKIIGEWT